MYRGVHICIKKAPAVLLLLGTGHIQWSENIGFQRKNYFLLMGQKLDFYSSVNVKPMFSDCFDVVYFSNHVMCISIKAGGMLVPYWSQ